MWFITHVTSGESMCFSPEKLKYSVGRLGADVELYDDICVSRAHAAFHLIESDDNFDLKLEDLGSKYGTFLNKNIETNIAIEKGRKITLKNDDMIRFGRLQNIWKVQFMVIQTVASALTREDSLRLRTYIESLGGKILEQWSVNCTHLTMKDPSVTMKLLHALIEQKPVVTINYWRDLLSAVNNIKTHLPKLESYRPDFGDESIDFDCNPKRRTLFKGITFVFLNRKHFDMYGPVVKLAGGVCKEINTGVQKIFLIKEKVIVIQYTPSTQTQSSETIGTIAEFLEENSKRIIPEYEIGLAILHCSIDKYCNPSFKLSQTMSLTVPNDSSQIELSGTPNTSSLNTESMELAISETQETSVASNPIIIESSNQSSAASDNPRKRKILSMDLNESDDLDLFQFESKKYCNTKDNEVTKQKLNKPSNNNVFLQKSQNKISKNTEDEPSTSREPRKRPLIQVLNENDDDGNEDDLFSFGDTQNTKKARQQTDEESKTDNGLFNFKEGESSPKRSIRTIDVDEDSNDMEPTQKIVNTKKPPVQLPKPKIFPLMVSSIQWISSSLGKINIKRENSDIKNENNEENIKSELDVKPDPDAEITITEDHRKWIESLKDAIEIQKVSLSNTLKYADKSLYKFKNSVNNSAENINKKGLNYKKFVKKYEAPLENNTASIKLQLR